MLEPIPPHWADYWYHTPLLAFVEQREPPAVPGALPVRTRFVLDVSRRDDLLALRGGGHLDGRLVMPPSALVVLSVPANEMEPFDAYQEGAWQPITLSPVSGAHPARLYRDLDGPPRRRVFMDRDPSPIDPQVVHDLHTMLSLNDIPPVTSADLVTLGGGLGAVDFVEVVDIGQGNCNAMCDSGGAPVLYFDLGGECLANARTYPASITFCYRSSPPVFLSHWDFDHWYSGNIHARAQTLSWFAPNKKIGPTTRRFVSTLKTAGVLKRWPPGLGAQTLGGVTLDLCSGSTKNDSGLACMVKTGRGDVLCPADAEFNYVPGSFSTSNLGGLLAAHHGSRHTGTPIPAPATHGASPVAYSYGLPKNTYKHPAKTAVACYRARGWRRLNTPAGHISIGAAHGASHAPCACTLITTQS